MNEKLSLKIIYKQVEVKINKKIPGQIEGGNKKSAGKYLTHYFIRIILPAITPSPKSIV
jgi:hypothetical protein